MSWKDVSELGAEAAAEPLEHFLTCCGEHGIERRLLESEDGAVAATATLAALAASPEAQLDDLGQAEGGGEVVFAGGTRELAGLNAHLGEQDPECRRWAAVPAELAEDRAHRRELQKLGATDARAGLRIGGREYRLHRLPPPRHKALGAMALGARAKIAEDGDNLRRREDWFRRRAGDDG